ncbi:MAG TPA: hypothetical protein VFV93_03700 [Thermomicrobiales bacterium]|nr:hypothetical protein [Thermomicrobiales bacterium]
MAQIARSIEIDIDWLLDFLTGEWRNVESVALAWDTLDQEARLDYLNEWPITESYGDVLDDAASHQRLTPDQDIRYQQLQHLIRKLRPTIEHLLAIG